MRFLKTLLWVTVIVGLIVFAINNWVPVTVGLWGGLRLDTKLPALVVVAFLIGFVPLYCLHRAQMWRMKRRIMSLENAQHPVPPVTPSVARPVAPPAYNPGDAL